MIEHHFSVDVEEYFQVSAFDSVVRRQDWPTMATRAHASVNILLEMLDRHGSRGTFFVLGCLADLHPEIVRDIAAAGHEIASHGWDHRRVTTQRPEEFRESVHRTKHALEAMTGVSVLGFRAPSFSIVPGFEWALDVLIEEGYRYDSSLFPVRRPGGYGYPGIRPHPHWMERAGGRIAEFPLTTLRRFGVAIPAAGGAYFRIFPYRVIQSAFAECERLRMPGTFYLHPWEVDPEQPRLAVPLMTRVRHYTGLQRTVPRLERLLGEFRFTTIAHTLDSL